MAKTREKRSIFNQLDTNELSFQHVGQEIRVMDAHTPRKPEQEEGPARLVYERHLYGHNPTHMHKTP